MALTYVVLTSGSTWTVPSDWNSANNIIQVIGGGGAGAEEGPSTHYGAGGGGGAYAFVLNQAFTPGNVINIQVGQGGTTSGTNGTSTYVYNNSNSEIIVEAGGGEAGQYSGSVGGNGGTVTVGSGYPGGSGGSGGGGSSQHSGGGGAGAAGPFGPGGNGGCNAQSSGGGGGGNGGGTNGGAAAAEFPGGNGGNNFQGSGGGTGGQGTGGTTTPGTNGGGGGGGSNDSASGEVGGNGTDLCDSSYGSGGGGGGAGVEQVGSNGGLYGGGGGGNGEDSGATVGQGANGIIVIGYNPTDVGTFTYHRSITVDHTQVGSSNLSNYPLLVNFTDTTLKTTANGGHVQSANAYDICFTSDEPGTEFLNWEIQYYNPSTGQVIAWVQIPTLSVSSNTVVYMQYGNANFNWFQGGAPGSAWNSNYKQVYHLQQPSGPYIDSTSNQLYDQNGQQSGNNGVDYPVTATGLWGTAQSFVAADTQMVRVPNFGITPTPCSISGWMLIPSGSSVAVLVDTRDSTGGFVGYIPYMDGDSNKPQGYYNNTTGLAGSAAMNDGDWHYWTLINQGSSGTFQLYIDGTSVASETGGTASTDDAGFADIGAAVESTWATQTLQEVRISNQDMTSYVTADYNTQKSGQTAVTIGSEGTSGTEYTMNFSAGMQFFSATAERKIEKEVIAKIKTFLGTEPVRVTGKNVQAKESCFKATNTKAISKTVLAVMAYFKGIEEVFRRYAMTFSASMNTFTANVGRLFTVPTFNATLSQFQGFVGRTRFMNVHATMAAFAARYNHLKAKIFFASPPAFSASTVRQTDKDLSGHLTFKPSLHKKTTPFRTAAKLSQFAGTTIRKAGKKWNTAQVHFSGTYKAVRQKFLGATLHFKPALSKLIDKPALLNAETAPFKATTKKATTLTAFDATMSAFNAHTKRTREFIWRAVMNTFEAVTHRKWGIKVPAHTSPFSTTLSKAITNIQTAAEHFAGTVKKDTEKQLPGSTVPFQATTNKTPGKLVQAALHLSANVYKLTSYLLPKATMAPFALSGLYKLTSKTLNAFENFAGMCGRGWGITINSATIMFNGSMVRSKAKIMSAVLRFAPVLTRTTEPKSITPEIKFEATTTKAMSRELPAKFGFVANVLKNTTRSFKAVMESFTGQVMRARDYMIAGFMAPFSGTTKKDTTRTFDATQPEFEATATKQTGKNVQAAFGFAGKTARSWGIMVTGAMAAFTGRTSKLTGYTVKATQSAFSAIVQAVAGIHTHFMTFAATLPLFNATTARQTEPKPTQARMPQMSGSVTRQAGKLITPALRFTGSVVKAISKDVSATLHHVAAVFRASTLGGFVFRAGMNPFAGQTNRTTGKNIQAATAPMTASVTKTIGKLLKGVLRFLVKLSIFGRGPRYAAVFTVPFENRMFTVQPETRTFTIAEEPRSFDVQPRL